MIVNRGVVSISPQKTGRLRVRFRYSLADGRSFIVGPMSVADLQEANSRLTQNEPELLLEIKRADSDDAVNRGLDAAFKEASANEVKLAWIRRAFNEDNHFMAYRKMKRIMPKIMSLGRTDLQNGNAFGITLEEFRKLKKYWVFLDTNKLVIIAYSEIQGLKG